MNASERVARAVLCLDAEDGREEARVAFRRLSLRFHPDVCADPLAPARFRRVVKAYKTLQSALPALPERPFSREYDVFDLGNRLMVSDSPDERADAAKKLGLCGRQSAFVFLRHALQDHDERVVRAGVRAFAMLGSARAEGEIGKLYARSGVELRRFILETAAGTLERSFKTAVKMGLAEKDKALSSLARAAFRLSRGAGRA